MYNDPSFWFWVAVFEFLAFIVLVILLFRKIAELDKQIAEEEEAQSKRDILMTTDVD